jgi:hypothetical protein
MSTRRESRVTAQFTVVDQRGVTHLVTERTDFLHVSSLDGDGAPIPGLKEYLMEGRHLNRNDANSFETPDGALKFTRV